MWNCCFEVDCGDGDCRCFTICVARFVSEGYIAISLALIGCVIVVQRDCMHVVAHARMAT